MADETAITIRFTLNLPTEDPAYVDVVFADARQARRALNTVLTANGPLVSLKNATDVPVLIRSADVSAAFPIDYEGNSEAEADEDEADEADED